MGRVDNLLNELWKDGSDKVEQVSLKIKRETSKVDIKWNGQDVEYEIEGRLSMRGVLKVLLIIIAFLLVIRVELWDSLLRIVQF